MKIKSLVAAALCGIFLGFMVGAPVTFARVTAPSNTTPSTPDAWCAGRSAAEVCVDRSGNILPTTTNNQTSGTSSLRWSNVLTTLLNVSGAATLSSTLAVTGPITASAGVGVIQSTAPRTSTTGVATLYATYAIPAGTIFLNTTNNFLCHSTGTVQTSIVQSTSPTTACS